MSLQDWAVGAAAKGMIKDAEKDGRIQEAVNTVASMIKGLFPADDKTIKQMFVQYCVFPFCRLLLKDNPDGLAEAKKGL